MHVRRRISKYSSKYLEEISEEIVVLWWNTLGYKSNATDWNNCGKITGESAYEAKDLMKGKGRVRLDVTQTALTKCNGLGDCIYKSRVLTEPTH